MAAQQGAARSQGQGGETKGHDHSEQQHAALFLVPAIDLDGLFDRRILVEPSGFDLQLDIVERQALMLLRLGKNVFGKADQQFPVEQSGLQRQPQQDQQQGR